MVERWDSVESFVTAVGGRRVIKKVLIANNGIAAVKAIRSIRRWAYETFGNEREVRGKGREGEASAGPGGECVPHSETAGPAFYPAGKWAAGAPGDRAGAPP